jgi:hypothetical protein
MKNGTIENLDDLAKVAELMFENSGLSAAVGVAVRADLARIVKAAADESTNSEDLKESDFPDFVDQSNHGHPNAEDLKAKEEPGFLENVWDKTPDSLKLVGGVAGTSAALRGANWSVRAAGGLPESGLFMNAANIPFRAAKGTLGLGWKGLKGVGGFGMNAARGALTTPAVTPAAAAINAGTAESGGLFSAEAVAAKAADPATKTLGYRAGSLGRSLIGRGAAWTAPRIGASEVGGAGSVASGLGLGAAGIGAGWLGGRVGAVAGGYKAEDSDKLYGSLLAPGGGSKENQGMLENLVAGMGGAHGADVESRKGTDLRAAQQNRIGRQADAAGMKPDDYLFQHQNEFRAKKGLTPFDRSTWKQNAPGAGPMGKALDNAATKTPEKAPEKSEDDYEPVDIKSLHLGPRTFLPK